MSKVKSILDRSWSVAFALIPVVHVLYLIFNFLFAQTERKFYLWAIPVSLIPSGILLALLPNPVTPLAYYLFFAALAVIQYFRCKGCEYACDRRIWVRIVILVIPILLILGTYAAVYGIRGNLEHTVENIMETAIAKDELAWFDVIHPKCDADITTIKRLYQTMNESGVRLSGPVEDVKIRSFSKQSENGVTNTTLSAEVTAGGETYLVDIWIYGDWEYNGVKSLSIKPA
ncbi:MAG: hypothetical protein IKE57_07010 [Oscillospiraceae bacterium]|nr:hypothetical protein [Oscillospiraceae bacterium]